MKIKIINKSKIIKYFLILLITLLLSNASVGALSPFLFAFYFACLYVGINEKIISIINLFSYIVFNFSLQSFFISLTVSALGLIVFYVHKLFKRRYNLISCAITYILSLVTFVYYNIHNIKFVVFYIVLGVIFFLVSIVVIQVMLIKSNCLKLTLDESICCMFFLAILGLGVRCFNFDKFSIFKLVVTLIIYLSVAAGFPSITYSVALALSFGAALYNFNLAIIAEIMILAMASSVFTMPNKLKIIIISVFAELVVQYLFVTQTTSLFYNMLPIVVAGVIFLCVPNKFIQNLSNLIYVKKSELSSRNAINTTRKSLRKRMSQLSNVFLDMKHIHLNMVKKELGREDLVAMLNREIVCSCCRDCIDKNRCTRSLGTDNKSNIMQLIEIALTKGKVTLLDIPASLSNRCSKINNLISLINRLNDEYKQYKNMLSDVNNVKILLADQMGAVSSLLLDIGNEIDTNVKFDIANENKIISKLLSNNIQCREVLIYEEKDTNYSAELIVKANSESNAIIEKVVSSTLRCPMQISKVMPLEETSFNSVTLTKQSKYDCVFGLSSCNKAGEVECGDCHSIIRLNKNKFLLALCDGMGSGKNAHQMSAVTLSLIENFYKVGFNNEIIIESVNKLLAVNNQENYSTLDICVLDLEKCVADFIKVGAPFGLIKRESNIEIVQGGALPIGALDNITPNVSKTVITIKDIIILATDGITDAFETEENLTDFVSKLATNNPQTIADAILNEALMLSNMSAKDDMTVLVARIYLKN